MQGVNWIVHCRSWKINQWFIADHIAVCLHDTAGAHCHVVYLVVLVTNTGISDGILKMAETQSRALLKPFKIHRSCLVDLFFVQPSLKQNKTTTTKNRICVVVSWTQFNKDIGQIEVKFGFLECKLGLKDVSSTINSQWFISRVVER